MWLYTQSHCPREHDGCSTNIHFIHLDPIRVTIVVIIVGIHVDLHPSCVRLLNSFLKHSVKWTCIGSVFSTNKCMKCNGHGLSISCVKWHVVAILNLNLVGKQFRNDYGNINEMIFHFFRACWMPFSNGKVITHLVKLLSDPKLCLRRKPRKTLC